MQWQSRFSCGVRVHLNPMSIPVDITKLADAVAAYRFAYLLSVGEDRQAHAVATQPQLAEGRFTLTGLGRRSRTNVHTQPAVTLLWPPRDADDYSLIIDGDAALDGEVLTITPTRAVLHRPAPSPDPASACASDCMELPLG